MYAAQNNDIEIVKLLLDKGANKHLTNPDGETALSFAMKKRSINEELKSLLSN